MKPSLVSAVLLAIALSVGLVGIACEKGVNIDFENRTDRDLTVTFARPSFSSKSIDAFVVKAGSKTGYSYPGLVDDEEVLQVEARDPGGNLVYSETITLRQLKQRGLRFVFSETAPVTPSPTG